MKALIQMAITFFLPMSWSTNALADFLYSCAEAPAAVPAKIRIDSSGQLSFEDGIVRDANESGCHPFGHGGHLYLVISGFAFLYFRVPPEATAGAPRFILPAAIHGVNGMGPSCGRHRLICNIQ